MDPNNGKKKMRSTIADARSGLSGRHGESEKSLAAMRLSFEASGKRTRDCKVCAPSELDKSSCFIAENREFNERGRTTLELGTQPLAGKPLGRHKFPYLCHM